MCRSFALPTEVLNLFVRLLWLICHFFCYGLCRFEAKYISIVIVTKNIFVSLITNKATATRDHHRVRLIVEQKFSDNGSSENLHRTEQSRTIHLRIYYFSFHIVNMSQWPLNSYLMKEAHDVTTEAFPCV